MLYVARHGETDWNVLGLVCGQVDAHLTEKGYQQAEALAEQVAMLEPKATRIICSPLNRARETARVVIKKTLLPAHQDSRLMEMNYGKFDGKLATNQEFQLARKQLALPFEGGESAMDVAGRIYPLLDELSKEEEENYLLICHNAVIRVIDNYFRGKSTEDFLNFNIKNTQLMTYEF